MNETEIQSGGFEKNAVAVVAQGAGDLAAATREQSEIQSAIVSAKRFPRDEAAAYTKIIKAFERPLLAESARYLFRRGKTEITGPSVDLARECARCWGNMRHGLRVVGLTETNVHIKGYALDLETNAYCEHEDQFAPLIQRKTDSGQTVWKKPDERDLRELISKRGAILVRNAILQLMPPDIVDAAMDKAAETMRRAAAGELNQNREDAVRRLALAFDRLGVNTDMLQKKLGHELSLVTEDELVELRTIWKSIHDGNSKREEHFTTPQKENADQTDDLNAKLGTKKPGKDAND